MLLLLRAVTTLGVVAPIYDQAGFSLGEAIFQVLDVVPHKHGAFAEADVAVADRQAARDVVKVIRTGGDRMLHLCEDGGACKNETDQGKKSCTLVNGRFCRQLNCMRPTYQRLGA